MALAGDAPAPAAAFPASWVVDTNVVVSGLITAAANAPTRVLLDLMLAGRCRFLLSEDVLSECRMVLLRPKIAVLHGLDESEADELLVRLAANARIVTASATQRASVSADAHLVAILEQVPGALLITGDPPLARRLGRRARSPRAVVSRL